MPRTIRQAWGDRIRGNAELKRFLQAFAGATGVGVRYAGPLGTREEPGTGGEAGCARMRVHGAGARLGEAFRLGLLEAAAEGTATRTSAWGSNRSAVAMRAAGQIGGYLVTDEYLAAPPDRVQVNRARHLLSREGVDVDEAELETWMSTLPVATPERQAALIALLQLAAEHLTAKFTERLAAPRTTMPDAVEQICRIVHAEYGGEISVPEVARRLGLSAGHMSRTFHHSTGLRLIEYIARYRAERARELLAETDRPIAEAAFACGFRSLSQFNRVFRAHFGETPREVRRAARG